MAIVREYIMGLKFIYKTIISESTHIPNIRKLLMCLRGVCVFDDLYLSIMFSEKHMLVGRQYHGITSVSEVPSSVSRMVREMSRECMFFPVNVTSHACKHIHTCMHTNEATENMLGIISYVPAKCVM